MTVGVERSVQACYRTWSGTYHDNYYGANAAYPAVHRDLVRRLLRQARARRVLDAGCGPASILRYLAKDGLDVAGFDLTPEMVDEARRVLARYRVPPARVWQGSVLSARSFRPPSGPRRQFDAAICIGVLPHVPAEADLAVIRNLRGAVKKNGLVVAEARNQLFALFTLNRYSHQFFMDELIGVRQLTRDSGAARVRRALALVGERFRMDLPPTRKGAGGSPGYDEVLSRTHNPFVLRQQFERSGFKNVRVLFYHFHALPPMCEVLLPDLFRQRSIAMEDPTDWRGHFMASAFLVAATRA